MFFLQMSHLILWGLEVVLLSVITDVDCGVWTPEVSSSTFKLSPCVLLLNGWSFNIKVTEDSSKVVETVEWDSEDSDWKQGLSKEGTTSANLHF